MDLQITQYLDVLRMYLSSGYSAEEAVAGAERAMAELSALEMVSFLAGDTLSSSKVFYYFRNQPYFLLTLLFCGLTPILVTLNEKKLKARTSCSTRPSYQHTLALIGGSIIYGLGIWLVLLILCRILCPDGIMQQRILLANSIGLSMAFLCGVFVPQSMLPDAVLHLARFLPAYWYIRANNMLGGFEMEVFDMEFYWLCIGIQVLSALAVSTVAFALAKRRR